MSARRVNPRTFSPRTMRRTTPSFDKTNPLWIQMDKNRGRLTTEICYCSALGDCWTLYSGALTHGTTTETRHCPTSSAITFEQ